MNRTISSKNAQTIIPTALALQMTGRTEVRGVAAIMCILYNIHVYPAWSHSRLHNNRVHNNMQENVNNSRNQMYSLFDRQRRQFL